MSPTFEALVEMAMAGRPGPLQHALRRLSARLRRPLTEEDYPACVREMFEAFKPFAQDNGMPKRGRSLKDPVQERMRLIYSKWVESLVRDAYEEKRLLIQTAKENEWEELVGGRAYPLPNDKPSHLAREEIADEFGDVGSDAIKKMLRKKGTPP